MSQKNGPANFIGRQAGGQAGLPYGIEQNFNG